MFTIRPIQSMLLTTAAALLCTGMQLAGIDSLAAPRGVGATVEQLPFVLVTAQRDAATATVQQLPQVVVTARRAATSTALAEAATGSAS